MSNRRKIDELVKRFCDWLGRPHFATGFLDWLAGWLVRPRPVAGGAGPRPPNLAPADPADLWPPILMMAGTTRPECTQGDVNDGGRGPTAPTWPWLEHGHVEAGDSVSAAVLAENKRKCRFWRLTGMHGRPCRYVHGGSDVKCPPGTVGGWFWKYDVPAYGTIYYVDCCGKVATEEIWCNWSKEENWCQMGEAAQMAAAGTIAIEDGVALYTCTLALQRKDFTISGGTIQGIT
jgi:hypothetical protein